MNQVIQFIGHIHLIAVHLPIGWLFAVLFLDLIGLRARKVKAQSAKSSQALPSDGDLPVADALQPGADALQPVAAVVKPTPRTAVSLGLWMLIGTVVSFLPAVLTGFMREEAFEANAKLLAVIEKHETLMFVALGLVSSALVLRLVVRIRLHGVLKGAYMALILAAVAVMIVGA